MHAKPFLIQNGGLPAVQHGDFGHDMLPSGDDRFNIIAHREISEDTVVQFRV